MATAVRQPDFKATLKYKVIKNARQYNTYCTELEHLLQAGLKNKAVKEEIELLALLIEKWNIEHNTFNEVDPISLLKSLMLENSLRAKDLANLLQVSKGLVSDILSYKKGLSKDIIRTLAERFKVNQEALNRPYKLLSASNLGFKKRRVINKPRQLVRA